MASMPELQVNVSVTHDEHELDHFFASHPRREGQEARCQAIRMAALVFARVLEDTTPLGADLKIAIRLTRQAMLISFDAIACEGEVEAAYYAQKAERRAK